MEAKAHPGLQRQMKKNEVARFQSTARRMWRGVWHDRTQNARELVTIFQTSDVLENGLQCLKNAPTIFRVN
jgi:hypothetical protein